MEHAGTPPWHWLVDPGTFRPRVDALTTRDPLEWPDYADALRATAGRAGVDEAVVAGTATIGGHNVEVALFAFDFFGGSMGEVAGERIALSFEAAAERGVPFVLRSATGGARMQEGMVSLVQMPKLVAARRSLADAHMPFIAVVGNPTTGGVLASIVALADVTVAEDDALVGFAGPRLVERVTGRRLSPDSHTATSAYDHGLVDAVVPRSDVPAFVQRVLDVVVEGVDRSGEDEAPIADPSDVSGGHTTTDPASEAVDAWEITRAARGRARPRAGRLITEAFDEAVFLRGDRAGSPAEGVTTALVRVGSRGAVAIGTERDRPLRPEEFRAARRCVEIAARLGLPLVTIVDTPGADPSESSEAGGVAWSIAALSEAMLGATVPSLAIVTGEGGSGGALAFATADRVLVYDDAFFSVTAPEAAAEILWRDERRAADAAALLRITARDLVDLGFATDVVPGPLGAESLRTAVTYHLRLLSDDGPAGPERAAARRRRWRR